MFHEQNFRKMELNNGIKVYQFGIEKVLQKYGKNSF